MTSANEETVLSSDNIVPDTDIKNKIEEENVYIEVVRTMLYWNDVVNNLLQHNRLNVYFEPEITLNYR